MYWPQRAWMLTTRRSGSTWFCYLLNGAVGNEFNVDYASPRLSRHVFGEHFHEKCSVTDDDFWRVDPVVTKMHGHWLGRLNNRRPHSSTRIIRLYRRDIAAQARSLYLANRIGMWQATTAEKAEAWRVISRDEPISESRLAELTLHVQRLNSEVCIWASQFKFVLNVAYEDLLSHPREVVEETLRFLRVSHYRVRLNVPLYRLSKE